MTNEGRFSPESSKENQLQELKQKIDKIAGEIIKTWNEDKGWSLTLISEGDSKYIQEQSQKVERFNSVSNELHEKKNALADLDKKTFKFGKRKLKNEVEVGEKEKGVLSEELEELNEKQKKAREKFENLKKALENLLTEYYFTTNGPDREKEWGKKFPFARIYHPDYRELSTGQTSAEDKKRELADTKAYIFDFPKLFEEYGTDILKRENNN